MPTIKRQQKTSQRPNWAKRFCKGVPPSSTSWIKPAICPISVAMPVPTTSPAPLPRVTTVPIKAIFRRSPKGVFGEHTTSAHLDTGSDSPVKTASSTSRRSASPIRTSAGIISPVLSSTTSPGTSSAAGMTLSIPSRFTVVSWAVSFFSFSRDFSARYSCKKPKPAFIITMAKMVTASANSPKKTEIKAAAIKTRTMKSRN